MSAYKDTSIFDNVKQWTDENGTEYRAMWKGAENYQILRLENGTFIQLGYIDANKKSSCKFLQSKINEYLI